MKKEEGRGRGNGGESNNNKNEKDWEEVEWKDDFIANNDPTNVKDSSEFYEQFPQQNEYFSSEQQESSTEYQNGIEGNEQQYNYDEIDDKMKLKRPPLPDKSNKIELDLRNLGTGTLVGVIFVRSFFQGAVIGGLFGGLQGVIFGFQNRAALGGKIGPHVMQMSWASGKSFGLWLGTYQASTVLLGRVRHKNDVVNPLISGFLAGSISSLASRNRTQILYNGVASALLMSLMHTFSGGGPQLLT